jgi:hypothetical protein
MVTNFVEGTAAIFREASCLGELRKSATRCDYVVARSADGWTISRVPAK